jgi:hypothetical protein
MHERVIKKVTGFRLALGGEEPYGWLPSGAARPAPEPLRELVCTVEIVFDGQGWLLVCHSDDSEYSSDTWHESLERAEQQTQFEFGIKPSQWESA